MSEEEIVNQMKEFVDWIKANKDKVNKQEELLAILQGMLDLYQQEKEKNKKLQEEKEAFARSYAIAIDEEADNYFLMSKVIDMMAKEIANSDPNVTIDQIKEYYFKKARGE